MLGFEHGSPGHRPKIERSFHSSHTLFAIQWPTREGYGVYTRLNWRSLSADSFDSLSIHAGHGPLPVGGAATYGMDGQGSLSFVDKIVESILIVDDRPDDQDILVRGLRGLGVRNPVSTLGNGHEAIRYLKGDSPYNDRSRHPLPGVIFLDLKLPLVSGFEVLDWIHGTGLKRNSHIFIYSEIGNVTNVRRIYALGADSFLRKPVQEVDLMNLIYHFPKFWDIKADLAEGEASHSEVIP